MSCVCPTCGQDYQPKINDTWNFPEWRITTQFGSVTLKSNLQAKVFDLLWRKQGIKGLNRQRILDIIYLNDIDGGPEIHTMTSEMMRLRKLIEVVGIHVKRGYSGGEGYSLIMMTPEQAIAANKKQAKGLGCRGNDNS